MPGVKAARALAGSPAPAALLMGHIMHCAPRIDRIHSNALRSAAAASRGRATL